MIGIIVGISSSLAIIARYDSFTFMTMPFCTRCDYFEHKRILFLAAPLSTTTNDHCIVVRRTCWKYRGRSHDAAKNFAGLRWGSLPVNATSQCAQAQRGLTGD